MNNQAAIGLSEKKNGKTKVDWLKMGEKWKADWMRKNEQKEGCLGEKKNDYVKNRLDQKGMGRRKYRVKNHLNVKKKLEEKKNHKFE